MIIAESWQAVGINSAGLSNRRKAVNFGVNNSVINRHLARHRHTGTVKDRQRSGRPRKTPLKKTVSLTVKLDYSHIQRQCIWEVCDRLVVA